ncbi:MAG TPA: lysophospholipid acyltransferase family protein [Gemmatimonadaceae bacterium]|nr:lysophospholipid acyltransferase family protein [Gemmatimonadaceae bacterium]
MIILSILATISLAIVAPLATLVIGSACMLAALVRIPDRAGSPYDFLPRWWSKVVLFMTGVRVVVHNRERLADGKPHIFVANHMSWFDVPALSSFVPRGKFVAKAELFNVPVFGGAMRAVGMVPIERQNRKAAFGAYDEAARRIHDGNSIVVFPEGTRGEQYPLRAFKKGPFVLAIAAGAPIIPVLLHGTREVIARGSLLVRPGRVDVHLLEPVEVQGLGYEDRDQLAAEVRSRIASALWTHYGIETPAIAAPPGRDVATQPTTID